MKVSRVYSVESGEYVAVYFHPNLVKIVGDMSVLSLLVLPPLLRIIGVVAWLIYVSRILTKFCGRTSHCGHDLLLIPFNMVCSAWSAIQADKIGKHKRVFPSAQSITAPSLAISCNGARMRSNSACRASAFICRWISSARTDS